LEGDTVDLPSKRLSFYALTHIFSVLNLREMIRILCSVNMSVSHTHEENRLSVHIILKIECILHLEHFNDGADFFVKELRQLIETIILFLALVDSARYTVHFSHLKNKFFKLPDLLSRASAV
jgi:hypothetical protein